jgi:hypothetical protein
MRFSRQPYSSYVAILNAGRMPWTERNLDCALSSGTERSASMTAFGQQGQAEYNAMSIQLNAFTI